MADSSAYFVLVEKRPAGCPEYRKNDKGEVQVFPNEMFCRIYEDGSICGNDSKWEAASLVRRHIASVHPGVAVETLPTGRPGSAIKEAGAADLSYVVQCVLEHRGQKGRRSKAAGDGAGGDAPATPTKRKAKANGTSSAKKSRKNAKDVTSPPVAELVEPAETAQYAEPTEEFEFEA